MKMSKLISLPEIKWLKDEIDDFVDIIFEKHKYNDTLEIKLTDGGKEIFDSVWGPVEFNAAEIAILDSPLLQRLRKIKQLGFANYVYCGADYSRFHHTIGVFF